MRAVPLPTAHPEHDRKPQPRRAHSDFAREGKLFSVSLGAKDKADPRWLLPLICRRGGVTRRDVGAIRIGPRETLFEIAGEAAAEFAAAAAEPDPRAPHVVIRAQPHAANPARHPRAEGKPRHEHHPGKPHKRRRGR
jgi:ATP-dependent RNA helicase DeaD